MTNITPTPKPTPTDIIQAVTAMRSHWQSVQREIARKKEEIAHNRGELADMEEDLARTERGITALEEIFGPLSEEIETVKTSRRTGTGRVAVEECPLTVSRRQEMGEKYRALYAIAEALPGRVVHTRTAATWLIEAGLMPDQLDNARVALTSYMKLRPSIWDPVERGFFRLITPQTEAGSATQETGGETPEADPESDDSCSFTP